MRENVTVSKILSLQQGERWDEHSDKGKNSEPAKHLYQFPEHSFNWNVLRRVPNKLNKERFMKHITLCVDALTLNNQLELTSLTLFRNKVT